MTKNEASLLLLRISKFLEEEIRKPADDKNPTADLVSLNEAKELVDQAGVRLARLRRD